MDDPSLRSIAEKRIICDYLNKQTIREASPTSKMKGDQIALWFGYHCSRTRRKIFSIDPLFSASHYTRRTINNIKAFNFIRGGAFTADYEAFAIPIIVYNDPAHTDVTKIDKKVGHWCTGIYVRATNEFHYFDPYGSFQSQILPHVKTIINNCVNTVSKTVTKIVPNVILHKRRNEHNTQPVNDGETCGFYCCQILKRFLRNGLNNLYDSNFVLNDFKIKVVETIKALLPPDEQPMNTEFIDDEIKILSPKKIVGDVDEIQILPTPFKKPKLMPETPTDAFSTLKLNTPLIDLTEDKNDNSFLPKSLKENATPKRKIAPKKKIEKIPTVTEIKIINKAGVPPQRKIKINPASIDDILNETFLLQEKSVEPMEVDPNPSTISVDTVISKKKKGETGRPLSTKTQHKNLIESKRKVKESASSAAENDSDSTVITVNKGLTNEKPVTVKLEEKNAESAQLALKNPMEVDLNSSVISTTSDNGVKNKGGRPKKVKRKTTFNKNIKTDSESEAKQKDESVLHQDFEKDFEFSFTNEDGSKVCCEKTNENTQFVITGEFKKAKTSQELMPPPIIPSFKKAEEMAKKRESRKIQNESENDADNDSVVDIDEFIKKLKKSPQKKSVRNRRISEKQLEMTVHKIGLSTIVTKSEFPPQKIKSEKELENEKNNENSEQAAKNKGGRPKKKSTFKGKKLFVEPDTHSDNTEFKKEETSGASETSVRKGRGRPKISSKTVKDEQSDSSLASVNTSRQTRSKGKKYLTDSEVERATQNEGGRPKANAKKNQFTAEKSLNFADEAKKISKDKRSTFNDKQKMSTVNKKEEAKVEKMEVDDKPKQRKILVAARGSARLKSIIPKLLDVKNCTGKTHAEGCAAISSNHAVKYDDVGDFDQECPHCKAYKLPYEMDNPSVANKCCGLGEIHTTEVVETHNIIQNQMPTIILDLCEIEHPNNKEFVKKSVHINSLISFGTITSGTIPPLPTRGPTVKRLNGNISHQSSGLRPPDGRDPRCGQIYCIDLQEALNEISKISRDKKINEELLRVLHEMVRDNHVYSKLFKSGSEKLAESIADAIANGKEIPRFRLTIVDAREEKDFKAADPTVHAHRAEKPRDELIGMIWCNDDGDPPDYKGVWLDGYKGEIESVPYWSPNVDALCYSLLFPYGNQMYRDGLVRKKVEVERAKKRRKNILNDDTDISDSEVERHINGSDDEDDESNLHNENAGNKGRQFISRKEFYRYQMHPRNNKARKNKNGFKKIHWLWSKGQLADAYLIDIVCRAERCQMAVAKKKIETLKLRFTSSDSLKQFVEKTYLKPGCKLGSLFTIPIGFKGGRKYMQKAYADIMTIIDNTDLPSWFITFTGNPNWPEIQRNIEKGESRSDVKCRVFMAKAQEFLNELFKKDVMGKVWAYHCVMEFQKRGMPHLHVILIMEKRVTVDNVDDYVSARIPDLPKDSDAPDVAEQKQRLFDIITKNNIHLCNENSGCQVKGVCTKGFRKPYSQSTQIHTHMAAEYARYPPKPDDFDEKQTNSETEKVEKEIKVVEDKLSESQLFEKDTTFDEKPNANLHQNAKVEVSDSEEFLKLPNEFIVDEISETQKFDQDENFDYFDEPRKDLNVDEIEYKRLPKKPEGLEINATNAHLFGNSFKKEIRKNHIVEVDDSYVVPYNPYLSLKFNCHINVECTIGQKGSPKYTCKYTTKLGDVIYAKVNKFKEVQKDKDGNEIVDFDEAEQHIMARIMTGCEGWMRLNNTWIIKQSHIVETLHVHLEGEQMVYFEEGSEENAAEREDKSPLLAFFELCARDDNARQYTYQQIPHHYRYDKKKGVWIKRIYNPTKFFVRVHHIPPKMTQLYALRILLMKVQGPTSFKNLKTVNGVEHANFVEAAKALGYWENNDIHFEVINEAIREMRTIKQKKHFLAMVIAHNQPSNANEYIEKFLEPIFHKPPRKFEDVKEQVRFRALCYLEYIFQKMDTSCKQLGITVPENFAKNYDSREAFNDFEVEDELRVDGKIVTFDAYVEHQVKNLNPGQKTAFDRLFEAISGNIKQKFFFLQGSGGTGKTHVYNTLIDYCKMKDKKVLACASTGIAATLLKRGMTAHSALYIPKELNSESRTRIGAHTEKGQFLNELDLLIIDEVSMLHKEVLKYIDRTLRTIKDNDELFGGVTVLIGGDWKQLTPVVPRGQPSQVIEASVKSWEEFVNVEQLNLTQNMRVRDDEIEFVEELRQIGNGELQKFIPGTNSIQIDEENVVQTQQDLIDFCFEPAWLQYPTQHIEKLCGSAILCPTNTVVQQLNEEILNNMQGEEQVFTGIDTVISDKEIPVFNGDLNEHSIEAMNKIETAGMPPHILKLKKGAIVMLIKNLSVFTGLCNGTRMQVIGFNKSLLKCKLLSGSRSQNGEIVFLPLCKFEYGNVVNEPGVHFTRTQFPVKLSFAISINKAQGQTLERVGLNFRQGECFSHGQLYTAMSRVRTKDSIKIFPASKANTCVNVVWHRLLDEKKS